MAHGRRSGPLRALGSATEVPRTEETERQMAHQSVHSDSPVPEAAPTPRVAVETNGINVIAENERKGTPRQLFWPWFGANVSVFGLAYGSFLLGFGISFWQAIVAGVVGIVVSFLLCGLVAIAGK